MDKIEFEEELGRVVFMQKWTLELLAQNLVTIELLTKAVTISLPADHAARIFVESEMPRRKELTKKILGSMATFLERTDTEYWDRPEHGDAGRSTP